MERYFNVHEALQVLNKHFVTDSISMVTRWIREGRITAERTENRKEGWRIKEEDLYEFINEYKPGILQLIHKYEEDNNITSLINGIESRAREQNEDGNKQVDKTIQSSLEIDKEIGELKGDINRLSERIENVASEVNQAVMQFDTFDNMIKEVKAGTQEIFKKEVESIKDMIKQEIQEAIRITTKKEKDVKGSKKESDSPNEHDKSAKYKISFSQFKDIGRKVLKISNDDYPKFEQKFKDLYDVLFTDGRIKDDLIKDGKVVSPLKDTIKHSYPLAFIKLSFADFFNGLVKNDQDNDGHSSSSDVASNTDRNEEVNTGTTVVVENNFERNG